MLFPKAAFKKAVGGLFYGISTFVGHLLPNPVYTHILICK